MTTTDFKNSQPLLAAEVSCALPQPLQAPVVVEGVHQILLRLEQSSVSGRKKSRAYASNSDPQAMEKWISYTAERLWQMDVVRRKKRFPMLYTEDYLERVVDAKSMLVTALDLRILPKDDIDRLLEMEPLDRDDAEGVVRSDPILDEVFWQLHFVDYHLRFLEAGKHFGTLTDSQISDIKVDFLAYAAADIRGVSIDGLRSLFDKHTTSSGGRKDAYAMTLRRIESISVGIDRVFIPVYTAEKILTALTTLGDEGKFLPPGFDARSLDSVRFVQWERIEEQTGPEILVEGLLAIASYPGVVGQGDIMKTHSLFPGEKAVLTIETYQKESTTYSLTSSVLDSSSLEAEESLSREINYSNEYNQESTRSSSFSAGAEGKAVWGAGSGSVNANHSSSTSSSTKRAVTNSTKALSNQASKVSKNRTVKVETSSTSTQENSIRQSVVRTIENINVSRVLNFVFRQLNQRVLSLISVRDVRITLRATLMEDGKVFALEEVPDGLRSLFGNDEEKITECYRLICEIVAKLAYNDAAASGRPWMVPADEIEDQERPRYRINPKLDAVLDVSDEQVPAELTTMLGEVEIPKVSYNGVLLDATTNVVRSPGVYIDSYLSGGCALDEYSTTLQTQAGRAKQIENRWSDSRSAALDTALAIVAEASSPEMRAEFFRRLVVPILQQPPQSNGEP